MIDEYQRLAFKQLAGSGLREHTVFPASYANKIPDIRINFRERAYRYKDKDGKAKRCVLIYVLYAVFQLSSIDVL